MGRRDAQPLSLPDGVVNHATVCADPFALRVEKVAGLRNFSRVPLNESGIVPVRHKADVLAVRLVRIEKAVFLGDLTHPVLGKFAHRELGVRQLFLGQIVQYIALILAAVQPLFQQIAPGSFVVCHPGIVSGDNGVHLHFLHPEIELFKFQIAVAVDAGVGRPAVFIGVDKPVHDLFFEVCRKVENIVGHMQTIRHAPCVLHIVQGAAGLFPLDPCLFVLEQFHGRTDAFIAFLLHQKRRNGTVYAAAHGNQSLFHTITFFLELELVFTSIYTCLFGKFCCILRKKYLPGGSPPAYFFLVCNKIMLENPHIFLVKTSSYYISV